MNSYFTVPCSHNETNNSKFLEKPLDNVRTKGHTLESEISTGPLTGSCISPVCLIGAVSRIFGIKLNIFCVVRDSIGITENPNN